MLCRITGKVCTAWSETAGCGLVRCKFVEDKGGDEGMTDRRKDCPMRHENGNCTVAGGFCTAVNNPICEALHNAFDCGYRSALRQQEHFREVTKKVEPLTLDDLVELGIRAENGENIIVYCTPLNDWAKVFKFGLLFFGTEDYRSWPEIEDDYVKTWLAYRQKPEEV